MGSDGIEVDVHLTKDDQIVVIHDSKVNRTTNGKGLVRNLTLAELRKLDAGSWFSTDYRNSLVPALTEVLDLLVRNNYTGLLNIELKKSRAVYPKIAEVVNEVINES